MENRLVYHWGWERVAIVNIAQSLGWMKYIVKIKLFCQIFIKLGWVPTTGMCNTLFQKKERGIDLTDKNKESYLIWL